MTMLKQKQYRGLNDISGMPLTEWLHTESQVAEEAGQCCVIQSRDVIWATVDDSRDSRYEVHVIATADTASRDVMPAVAVVDVISHDGQHRQADVRVAVDMIRIGTMMGVFNTISGAWVM